MEAECRASVTSSDQAFRLQATRDGNVSGHYDVHQIAHPAEFQSPDSSGPIPTDDGAQ